MPTTPDICHRCALLADPEVCINETGAAGTPDYLAPEMVTATQLFLGCEDLDDLDGHTRNLIAADAWAAGAIIFFAATGGRLVQGGPQPGGGSADEYLAARLAYLQQVHVEWQVGLCSACMRTHHAYAFQS